MNMVTMILKRYVFEGMKNYITPSQVATDGNHVPTLHWTGSLTANGGRTDYVLLEKMLGLKRIKTHTSNIPFSGTDGNLKVRLR